MYEKLIAMAFDAERARTQAERKEYPALEYIADLIRNDSGDRRFTFQWKSVGSDVRSAIAEYRKQQYYIYHSYPENKFIVERIWS